MTESEIWSLTLVPHAWMPEKNRSSNEQVTTSMFIGSRIATLAGLRKNISSSKSLPKTSNPSNRTLMRSWKMNRKKHKIGLAEV